MKRLSPFVKLVILIAAISIYWVALVAQLLPLDPFSIFVLSLVHWFSLVIWMEADARWRRITPCFDFGLFLFLSFPLSLPWYLFWSRGWRGMVTLAGLFVLWLVPWVTAVAASLVFFAAR